MIISTDFASKRSQLNFTVCRQISQHQNHLLRWRVSSRLRGRERIFWPTPWGHWVIVIFWCKKIIRPHKFEPLKYTTFDLKFGHRGTGRSSVPSQNCLVEPGFNNRWGIGTYTVTRVPDESMLRGLHHLAIAGISLLENCYVQMYNLLECSPSIATSPDLTILQVEVNWRMPQLDECPIWIVGMSENAGTSNSQLSKGFPVQSNRDHMSKTSLGSISHQKRTWALRDGPMWIPYPGCSLDQRNTEVVAWWEKGGKNAHCGNSIVGREAVSWLCVQSMPFDFRAV